MVFFTYNKKYANRIMKIYKVLTNIFKEVFKFSYDTNSENNGNKIFSEKLFYYTITMRKKVIELFKWSLVCIQLTFSVVQTISSIVEQSMLPLPVISIERLIENRIE
jgi:hypothetical protein